MSIFVTGDTHQDFSRFEDASGTHWHTPPKQDDYVIITGDFGGVWDGGEEEQHLLDWLSERPFTTLWVDGNHENFDLLEQYPAVPWHGGKVQFIRNNIIHLIRGYVYDIDGRTFFTMGGARSNDITDGVLEPHDPDFSQKFQQLWADNALFRVNHLSWWEQELPSEDEYARARENLAARGNKVDYIVTHCAPTSIQEAVTDLKPNALTDFLDEVKDTTQFRHWLFGHYHNNVVIDGKYALIYEQIVQIA